MVAVIKTGHSIHRIFNYNENKVKEGMAECIGAENYPVDHDKMSMGMKLKRLLKQTGMNERAKRNSVHISLNFDVSENHLAKGELMAIAIGYMEGLGFGKQPYLVYRHYDAGHPHIHLVTTNIEADGKRIDLHHLGIRRSEPARKHIEEAFGLVKAEEQENQASKLEALSGQRVQYGKSETKRALQNVLDHVIGKYKFTSLPELNAVLKQYNVMAERGSENSRVYRHKGLLYRVLDADGNPIGIPIKASRFYNKPTLKFLEGKYVQNEARRKCHKARVKNAIDLALLGKEVASVHQLIKALEKEGIGTALRKNRDGLIYGITYVDHRTESVFNGSALGKRYSAKAIQERCGKTFADEQKTSLRIREKYHKGKEVSDEKTPMGSTASQTEEHVLPSIQIPDFSKILDALAQPEQVLEYLPYHLKKKRKKKKRKRILNRT